MGKYLVRVPHLRDQKSEVIDIEVDVQNPENAIPRARARNSGPGYLWDKAEVLKRDRYQFQRARIVRIASELAPGKAVEFDEASTLRFGCSVFRTRCPLIQPCSSLSVVFVYRL